jgi:malate synthase
MSVTEVAPEAERTEGVQVLGDTNGVGGRVLTPEALAFVAGLHRAFNPRRMELLRARDERQAWLD